MAGWLKIVLFVSLALNLAVAGMIFGGMARHSGWAGQGPVRGAQALGPYTVALDRQDRRAIWREMRGAQGDVRSQRAQSRAEFGAVLQALRAQPYAADDVRRLIGAQFEQGQDRQQIAQRLLLERIDAMSPDERAAFADRLSDTLTRRAERARD